MDIEKVTLSTDSGNATVPTLEYTQQLIANLVNSAPAALDTLKELANALGNDPNFATTITNLIGQKAPNTTMTAATASAAGKTGLVPAPSAGSQTKFLRGDGTWQPIISVTFNE